VRTVAGCWWRDCIRHQRSVAALRFAGAHARAADHWIEQIGRAWPSVRRGAHFSRNEVFFIPVLADEPQDVRAGTESLKVGYHWADLMPGKRKSKGAYMISAVAEMYGIHPQTLRLYEREGLLKPSRTEGNTRLYTDEDLQQLEFILSLARDLG